MTLRRTMPLFLILSLLTVAGPALGAGISVVADKDQSAAAAHLVSVTGAPPTGPSFSPNPVNVATGDMITWNVAADAFVAGEVTAEIYIKPGQAIAAGVVAGPSVAGALAGGLAIPSLPAGTVVKYGLRFRNGAAVVVRDIDPDIVVAPGLGTVGLALLSVVLAGLGVLALARRRSGATLGA